MRTEAFSPHKKKYFALKTVLSQLFLNNLLILFIVRISAETYKIFDKYV